MTHPDPRVREVLERNARDYAEATTAPPADVVSYLEWRRNRPVSVPQRPRQARTYLDRSQIPHHHRKGADAPLQRSGPPPQERDPRYDRAKAQLQALPDFGAASIEAVRAELPADASWQAIVIAAAARPVIPQQPADEPAEAHRPAAAAKPCPDCGTALDPDGSCLTCTTKATA
ncbi:hypothetical protein [Actinomadura opuntiae]|uniref:hypothetical protein n=1 Tax=Actinomadura sp. OS1-43 TaxID=604315 RepID=UPI00255ACFD3|nr:hypothetical protein [Actinomadura sp. OS1-43]MDL4812744.1 hypothetical protein [Actinomadura sp. OS1-43]